MAWLRGSEYADSRQFRPLQGNERARAKWLGRQAKGQGRITANALQVHEALIRHHGPDGRCDPKVDTLAAAAQCHRATALRSLDQLEACGLIRRTRRIVRTRAGRRQTSNAYELRTELTPSNVPRRYAPRKLTAPTRQSLGPQGPVRSVEEQKRILAAYAAQETQALDLAEVRRRQTERAAAERAAKLAAMWRR
jgi:DNA-binding MarR family transcriptional regulator